MLLRIITGEDKAAKTLFEKDIKKEPTKKEQASLLKEIQKFKDNEIQVVKIIFSPGVNMNTAIGITGGEDAFGVIKGVIVKVK